MNEADLQLLLDKRAIEETLYRYCQGLDRQDHQTLSSAYWEDAIDEHAGLYRGGPPELIDHLIDSVRGMRTMHAVSNVLIERVTPDIAWSESYVSSYHVASLEGNLRELVGVGRYLDRHEKRDGEWRIAHRKVVIDIVRDNEAVESLSAFPGLELAGQPYPQDQLYDVRDAVRKLARP